MYFILVRHQPLHVKVKQLNIFWIHLVTLKLVFCMRNSTSKYLPTDTSAHSCHIHFVISLLPTVCVTLRNINNLDWNDYSSSCWKILANIVQLFLGMSLKLVYPMLRVFPPSFNSSTIPSAPEIILCKIKKKKEIAYLCS